MTDLERNDPYSFYSGPNGRVPPHLNNVAAPRSEFQPSTPELSPASEASTTVTTTGLTRSLSTSLKSEESPVHQTQQRINIATSNPSHLFWVPASQHPEIAPGEFEEFLRTNALSMQKRSSLKRRSSILSVSFTPGDAEEEDNESAAKGGRRKEAMDALERGKPDNNAEQAEGNKKDRRRVRRSLSLNSATEALDQQIPDFLVFDRNSSPLDESRVLVPRADRTSLLRRGARTKFQRNSSFNPPKLVQEHDQNIRPSSFSGPVTLTDAPLQPDVPEIRQTAEPMEQIQELAVAKAGHGPPSPAVPIPAHLPSTTPPQSTSLSAQPPTPPEHTIQPEPESPRIEPQRKSSWSWSFKKSSSKPEPKSSLTVPEATPQPRPSKSSETPKKFGLSSLFSRKKSAGSEPSNAGAAAAATTAPPKDFQLNRINNNRLPLHIERAIYRLSHAKLANPRRPLHEQVLISNLMFWYLSIVSSSPQHQQRQHHSNGHENPRKMVKKGKRPPAPSKSNKHPPQHHPQKPSDTASYQQYMGASTGFVIPENYLRPNKNPSATPPTPANNNSTKRNQRRPSYYDSDEDDEDAESSDSSSEDESPSNTPSKDDSLSASMYTKKKR